MYVCVYVSFCNVCCIPTIINKWVNCNLTWMWRRLLAARSPRSLRSSREQVGTNLKKNCLWDFSSINLGVMIGLTKGELSDCSPAMLVLASDKDSLALDSLEISKDVSPNISPKITQDISQDLTRRCQGNSCPCRLFQPRLVGPKQHRPPQEPDHWIMFMFFSQHKWIPEWIQCE